MGPGPRRGRGGRVSLLAAPAAPARLAELPRSVGRGPGLGLSAGRASGGQVTGPGGAAARHGRCRSPHPPVSRAGPSGAGERGDRGGSQGWVQLRGRAGPGPGAGRPEPPAPAPKERGGDAAGPPASPGASGAAVPPVGAPRAPALGFPPKAPSQGPQVPGVALPAAAPLSR